MGMLFTRRVFTFRKASEECGLGLVFLRIIFYSVRHGSEGQEPEGVWVLSEAGRLRGWEGGRGPGQGGDGDVVAQRWTGQEPSRLPTSGAAAPFGGSSLTGLP